METNGLILGDNLGYVQALSKYYRLGAADAIEFILDGEEKMNHKNGCDLPPSIGPIRILMHHPLFLHGGQVTGWLNRACTRQARSRC